MNGVLRTGNFIVAALTISATVVALIFLPDAWAQRSAEPEDLLVLAVLIVLMGLFTAIALLSYWELKADYYGEHRAKWLVGMNLVAALLCAAGVLLGYTSGQPSSVDMYVLALPGLLFGLNAYVLVKRAGRRK